MPKIEIFTRSGLVDVLNLQPDDIHIEDIANALANTCRFGGHVREFYSVAQHSVLVCRLCPYKLKLQGLLHDAAEAYIGDIVGPIKAHTLLHLAAPLINVMRVQELEQKILDVVFQCFGLPPGPLHPEVIEADRAMLEVEIQNLVKDKQPQLLSPLDSVAAYNSFMRVFRELTDHT